VKYTVAEVNIVSTVSSGTVSPTSTMASSKIAFADPTSSTVPSAPKDDKIGIKVGVPLGVALAVALGVTVWLVVKIRKGKRYEYAAVMGDEAKREETVYANEYANNLGAAPGKLLVNERRRS
jgi:hypothetical protein